VKRLSGGIRKSKGWEKGAMRPGMGGEAKGTRERTRRTRERERARAADEGAVTAV
jgi:hypothetical protein